MIDGDEICEIWLNLHESNNEAPAEPIVLSFAPRSSYEKSVMINLAMKTDLSFKCKGVV